VVARSKETVKVITESLATTSLNPPPTVPSITKATKKAKDKSNTDSKPTKQQPKSEDPNPGMIDLRVGLIKKAEKHPDADSLYVSHIDVGEEKERIVCSGLVKYIPLEEMQNRLVVCVCNLKQVKMRGIMSQAMVLAASQPVQGDEQKEKVELVIPPLGAKVWVFFGCIDDRLVQRFMWLLLRSLRLKLFLRRKRRFLRLCSRDLRRCRI
jgi:methionine--tRNA ligase beta chain